MIVFVPCLVRGYEGGEFRAITLGPPVARRLSGVRRGPGENELMAGRASDLKIFFEVVAGPSAEVRPADCFEFLAAQPTPRQGDKVVRIEVGEPGAGGPHDRAPTVERARSVRLSGRPRRCRARSAIWSRRAWWLVVLERDAVAAVCR